MDARTLDDTAIDPLTGAPRRAHLVPPRDGVPGHVRAFEARVMGTAVETLCGIALVPSRDHRTLPTCSRCLDVFRETTGAEDGWTDE